MKRPTIVIVCTSIILIVSLAVVGALSLEHDDATNVMLLFTTGVIPSTVSMFAFHQASGAKESAKQAVKNTNGILHDAMARAESQLIDDIIREHFPDVTDGKHIRRANEAP